jgi:phenylpropionate dioxygenase-like ring-hydroxylating dioxygenase large terminal subunit
MVGTTTAPSTFARPGIVRQGWYLLASTRTLRAGQIRPVEVGSRRLVVYRDLEGPRTW